MERAVWGAKVSVGSSVLCGGALQTLKKPRMDGRDEDDRRAVRPSRRGDADDRADTTRRDAIARVTMLAARRRAPARQVSSSHPNPKHTGRPRLKPGLIPGSDDDAFGRGARRVARIGDVDAFSAKGTRERDAPS